MAGRCISGWSTGNRSTSRARWTRGLAISLSVLATIFSGTADARRWYLPTHDENMHRAAIARARSADAAPPVARTTPSVPVHASIFNPHLADYGFRLMHGGTEMEIVGGFRPGLARAFFAFVHDKPNIKVIHLWSTGGVVNEARLVNLWAKLHAVDTYVDRYCMSACTIVFAAGKERWLGPNGRLGSHAAYRYDQFGNKHVSEKQPAADIFASDGVPAAFIERADAVAPSNMWFPNKDELIAVKVVTKSAFAVQFASSPYLDDWANTLKTRDPVTAQLAVTHQADFQSLAATTADTRVSGGDDALVAKVAAALMRRFLRTYVATSGDDRLIIDYGKVRSEELTFIDSKDPVACYAQSHHEEGHVVDEGGAPFLLRKADIDHRILASSQDGGKAPAIPKPLLGRFVRLMLTKASVDDIKTLVKTPTTAPAQARYCRALEAEYGAAVRLPLKDAVLVLRNM